MTTASNGTAPRHHSRLGAIGTAAAALAAAEVDLLTPARASSPDRRPSLTAG
jgi:hypothetical protein